MMFYAFAKSSEQKKGVIDGKIDKKGGECPGGASMTLFPIITVLKKRYIYYQMVVMCTYNFYRDNQPDVVESSRLKGRKIQTEVGVHLASLFPSKIWRY